MTDPDKIDHLLDDILARNREKLRKDVIRSWVVEEARDFIDIHRVGREEEENLLDWFLGYHGLTVPIED